MLGHLSSHTMHPSQGRLILGKAGLITGTPAWGGPKKALKCINWVHKKIHSIFFFGSCAISMCGMLSIILFIKLLWLVLCVRVCVCVCVGGGVCVYLITCTLTSSQCTFKGFLIGLLILLVSLQCIFPYSQDPSSLGAWQGFGHRQAYRKVYPRPTKAVRHPEVWQLSAKLLSTHWLQRRNQSWFKKTKSVIFFCLSRPNKGDNAASECRQSQKDSCFVINIRKSNCSATFVLPTMVTAHDENLFYKEYKGEFTEFEGNVTLFHHLLLSIHH